MGESFLKELENQLAAKVYAQKTDIRARRKEHVTSMTKYLAVLNENKYKLEQIRKARRILEAAEDNES